MKAPSPIKWAAACLALFAGTLLSTSAHAYCRTTTCDPNVSCNTDPNDCCQVVNGCDQNGIPISWPNSCVSYNIHEDGSEEENISAEKLSKIVDGAFDEWLGADCEGYSLSLAVENRGFAECGSPEYNKGPHDKNANVWMFRDTGDLSGSKPSGGNPIDSRTLAITTLSINVDTGAIYGVDVELNSALADFTIGNENVGIDLASIVTHEAGHFLGLDHSTTFDAVMRADYNPGDTGPRTLKPDDVAGICAIYTEDRSIEENTCDPRGKYSTECHGGCGCRIDAGPLAPSGLSVWWGLLLAGAMIARRSRRA